MSPKVHVHPFAADLPLSLSLHQSGNFRPAIFSNLQAYKGIFKYDFKHPRLDPVAFNRANVDYSNLVRAMYLHPCVDPHRVTQEEPNGSSGIFHKNTPKRHLLSSKGACGAIRTYSSIASTKPAYFVSFLKDEMRASHKDTRQINGGPLPHWLLETIYMLNSETAIEHNDLFAVGSTPFYGGWHDLISRLDGFSSYYASDVKMMDSHMHPDYMRMDSDLFRACHNSVCFDCVGEHDYVFDNTINTLMVMHNGSIWQKFGGHNSGGRCTCGRNSRYMLWLFCYASALLGWPGSVTEHVTPLIYGDDNVCGTNRSPSDMKRLFDAMCTVGHEIKVDSGPLVDLPFLSFKSVVIDGRYYPVPHDRVRFASHVVCGESSDPLVVESKMNSLRLLCLFDPPFYDEITSFLSRSGLVCYDRSFLESIMFPNKEARTTGLHLPRGELRGQTLEQSAQNVMSKKIVISKPSSTKFVSTPVVISSKPSKPRKPSSSGSSSSRPRGPSLQGSAPGPKGVLMVPCEVAASLVSQRMDPRSHRADGLTFQVPPTYGLAAAHYVCKPSLSIKFADLDGKKSNITMLFQRLRRSLLTTSGVARSAPLGASNTANVATFSHSPEANGSDSPSLWNPLFCGSFASLGHPSPANGKLAWPISFSTTLSSRTLNLKIAAPSATAHSLVFIYSLYNSVGALVSSTAQDLPSEGQVTVPIDGNITAGLQYWLSVEVGNNQPTQNSLPVIRGELYSNSDTVITFANLATTVDVSNIPVFPATNTNALVDAATLWIENRSSDLYNGGSVAGARVPSGWRPKEGETLYEAITNLVVDEFDGKSKTGLYAWNNQDSPFYVPRPTVAESLDANFLITITTVPDPANVDYVVKPTWSVFHSGGDSGYDYTSPCKTPAWVEVNEWCGAARAVTTNDTHIQDVKRYLSYAANFLRRPDVQRITKGILKVAGPLAMGLLA